MRAIIILLFISELAFGQKIEVMGHVFNVGDTITLTSGSMPNGDFICAQLNPTIYALDGEEAPHLNSYYTNAKLIIVKIKTYKIGINTKYILVIKVTGNIRAQINPEVGIAKKEILIK